MSDIDKLKLLKEKISKESKYKKQLRRENESCFIPSSYYIFGITKRDMFKKDFEKERRKLK